MYSYPQARARLVAGAISLGRAGIVNRLVALGSLSRPGDEVRSVRALAYRLAWVLLPAESIYVEQPGADLISNAVFLRTDARTGTKGGT
jgi:hypothetical protein